MDTLIEILKGGVIVLGIFIVIAIILIFGIFAFSFFKSIIVINKIENIVTDFLHNNEKDSYIWFEYYNETGIGRVYNKGTEENKIMYVLCIFSKNNAVQHIKLSDIEQYIPLKFETYNNENETVVKHNKINKINLKKNA